MLQAELMAGYKGAMEWKLKQWVSSSRP